MSFIDISFGPMNKEFIDAYKKGEIQDKTDGPDGRERMKSTKGRCSCMRRDGMIGIQYPTAVTIL